MVTEALKKEVILGLNVFNKPSEMIAKKAWPRLVLNLLFLRKGTYPSVPMMGIGLQDYEYEYLDAAVVRLQEEIEEQCRTYLPELPLTRIKVDSTEYEGQKILVIGITFTANDEMLNFAVAATVEKKIVDLAITPW